MSNNTQTQDQTQPIGLLEQSDFSNLLEQEFKPRTQEARTEVENAVRTLAEQALEGSAIVGDDVVESIEQMISAIDEQLTKQINEIIHHDEFQQLESAWRGLHYLVNNTESDEFLKIRFMNVDKKELAKTLKRYKGVAWDQSPVFKKIYEAEYGMAGGQPIGALIGDYEFGNTPEDIDMLRDISGVAAASFCPFICASAPSLFGVDDWSNLSKPRDLAF